MNGRITKKTFERWKFFSNFSNFIFSKIDLCLSSSKVSKFYLNRLGVKNLKYFGNLKFSQSENDKLYKFNDLKKIISKKKLGVHQVLIMMKKILWISSQTIKAKK